MARTSVTPDSLLFAYLCHYDPEFNVPDPYLHYFGHDYNFHLSPTPSLIFHDAHFGLLFRFLTDIPLQISIDPYLMSSLFPPEPEPVYFSSPPQAQDWIGFDQLYEEIEDGIPDEDSVSNAASSGSDCTPQIESSALDSDETLPPDSELELDVDVVDISEEESVIYISDDEKSEEEDSYDSQADLFDFAFH